MTKAPSGAFFLLPRNHQLTTWPQLSSYLNERGSAYGLSANELIDKTPDFIHSNPDALLAFWQSKDISHILPTSTHPHLASNPDNFFPEDPGTNRARQDQITEPLDQLTAWADNQIDGIKALFHFPVG